MISGLGEKIKVLRKEMKMTQSELAGTEMTNSMLSQIENNVTSPSMKTLQYIANRLNKPVSYFLDDKSAELTSVGNNDEWNKERESKVKQISDMIDNGDLARAGAEINEMINKSNEWAKIDADIQLKMGSSLIKRGEDEDGRVCVNRAIEIYADCGLYIEAAKAYVVIGESYYREFKYKECLEISEKAFDLYHKDINGDISFEIELYYYKVMILSSLGCIRDTLEALRKGMELCSMSSIYYKIDEFYRLYAAMNYLKGNKEEYETAIKKAIQFAEFSENRISLSNIYLLMAVKALEERDSDKALEALEKHKYYKGEEIYIYFLLKARAYYIKGEYESAYENIVKVDYPDYVRHKLDYLMLWSAKVYEGLLLDKLGKKAEAAETIKCGIEKMIVFDKSKALIFAYKSLSEVYSEMKDFENAFVCLKKADDMQEAISKDEEIIY